MGLGDIYPSFLRNIRYDDLSAETLFLEAAGAAESKSKLLNSKVWKSSAQVPKKPNCSPVHINTS